MKSEKAMDLIHAEKAFAVCRSLNDILLVKRDGATEINELLSLADEFLRTDVVDPSALPDAATINAHLPHVLTLVFSSAEAKSLRIRLEHPAARER